MEPEPARASRAEFFASTPRRSRSLQNPDFRAKVGSSKFLKFRTAQKLVGLRGRNPASLSNTKDVICKSFCHQQNVNSALHWPCFVRQMSGLWTLTLLSVSESGVHRHSKSF